MDNEQMELARHLARYAITHHDLYLTKTAPVISAVARRKVGSDFDEERSLRSWVRVVDAAALRYSTEIEGHAEPTLGRFTKVIRFDVARQLSKYYGEQVEREASRLRAMAPA